MPNDPTSVPSHAEKAMAANAQSRDRQGRSEDQARLLHVGMMGDGTEEQNLDQVGDPSARITKEEVQQAFAPNKASASPGETASDAAAEQRGEDEGMPAPPT